MNFFDSVVSAFKNYFNFSGRASRSEFWWFTLFAFVYNFVTSLIAYAIAFAIAGDDWAAVDLIGQLLNFLAYIPILPAAFCVTVRRLHDIGHSGWYQLVILIPCVGIIMYLVWTLTEGNSIPNVYGPVPTNQ